MHLVLSGSAPDEWVQIFEDEWRSNAYSKVPKAEVRGQHLVVISAPDPLENEHLPHLKTIVAATNRRYRPHHDIQAQAGQQQKSQEELDREALRKLKDRLKFD